MKSIAAGKIATTPEAMNKIPPITQPAPIEALLGTSDPLAPKNDGNTMNMKTPAITKQITAIRFNNPANLVKTFTFNKGKMIPQRTMANPTIAKIQPINANGAGLIEINLPLCPKITFCPL